MSSFGIALTMWSTVGVGAIDSTITGLAGTAGIPVWGAAAIMNVFLIGTATAAGEPLRGGTIACGVALGPLIAVAYGLLGTAAAAGVGQGAACVVGIFAVGGGAACQISAALGPSPLDTFMCAVAAIVGGVRRARTLIECVFIGVGFLLGGRIGWGTAFSAAATGPVIVAALWGLGPIRARLGT